MKLSLFTPTHAPGYLPQVYASLLQQDHADWEWVILYNGPESARRLKDLLARYVPEAVGDARVRVAESRCRSDKVGALKREACDLCLGDAFIEMDHDDLLTPGTLAKVAAAVEGGAGFVYSDVAVFQEANADVDRTVESWGYSKRHGWEHEEVTVYGQRFVASKCFDLTPRMLCEVYYAPDHVRCWSRKAYYAAGGHDVEMSVGDDHDLICRTYLAGVPFVHVGGCGYLYRYHASNTVKLRNRAIQQQQARNRHKYLFNLVGEWCRRRGHAVLDLMAAKEARQWDPDRPLRFCREGDSFRHSSLASQGPYGHVVASDVLQFVRPDDLAATFNALYETLVPGGYLTVVVPSANGLYADQNPLHRTRFNPNTFLHFSNADFARVLPGVKCRFDLIQTEEFYPSETFKKFNMKMLRADLCALKGQRHPGPTLI